MLRALRTILFIVTFLSVYTVSDAQTAFMRANDVSGGEYHTLVLMRDGNLWTCGANGTSTEQYGQLGVGDYGVYSKLVPVHGGETGTPYLGSIIDFDAGWQHSLAVNNAGVCLAWGCDKLGEIGTGPGQVDSTEPNWVHGPNNTGVLSNIVALSAGRSGEHSLAVESAALGGHVYAWGSNGNGQCGNGAMTDCHYPVRVRTSTGDLTGIVKVEAGKFHSLALDNQDRVWQWGYDSVFAALVQFPDPQPHIKAIAACDGSVALDSDGYVWQWAKGTSPQKVPAGEMGGIYLRDITAVGKGQDLQLALDGKGNVWAWGAEPNKPEYGNDNGGGGKRPVKVHDGEMNTPSGCLENIAAIDAGYKHSLAVDRMGQAWAWGRGEAGHLGDGRNVDQFAPV